MLQVASISKRLLALQEQVIILLTAHYQSHLQTENVWTAPGNTKSGRIYLGLSLLLWTWNLHEFAKCRLSFSQYHTTTSFYLGRTRKVEVENSPHTPYTCKSRRKQAALLPSAWQLDPLVIKDGGECNARKGSFWKWSMANQRLRWGE